MKFQWRHSRLLLEQPRKIRIVQVAKILRDLQNSLAHHPVMCILVDQRPEDRFRIHQIVLLQPYRWFVVRTPKKRKVIYPLMLRFAITFFLKMRESSYNPGIFCNIIHCPLLYLPDMIMNKLLEVILVDDDPFVLAISKKLILDKMPAMPVHTFNSVSALFEFLSGREAIEYDRRDNVKGLIISDFHMPDMNGLDLLEIFEKMSLPIRSRFDVYIMTSIMDRSTLKSLYEKPVCRGVFSKPLTARKFIDMLFQSGF